MFSYKHNSFQAHLKPFFIPKAMASTYLCLKFFNLHLAIYLHAKTKTRQERFKPSIILFHYLLRILSNLGVYRSHNNLIFLLFLILRKYHYTEFLKKRNIDCTYYKMKFHHNKKEQTPRTENHIHSTTCKITAKKKKTSFWRAWHGWEMNRSKHMTN